MSSEEKRRIVTSEETTFTSGEEGDDTTIIKQGEPVIAIRDHPTDGFAEGGSTGIVIIRDDGGDDEDGDPADDDDVEEDREVIDDGGDDNGNAPPSPFDPCAITPPLLTTTRGLVDHWIAECVYITTQSGHVCTGPLDFWSSTQVGRTRFDELNADLDPVLTIVLLENQINSFSAIFLPDDNPISSGNDYLNVDSSENNAAYDYLHGANGWVMYVWEQVESTIVDSAGLIRQAISTSTGMYLRVQASDLETNPDTIRFIIRGDNGGVSDWFDVVFDVAPVQMAAWNSVVISWDSGGSRDGIRIILNGEVQDFDATEFNFAHGTITATRPLTLGRRKGGGDNESPIKVAELAMGNVSLTDDEMISITDYIFCKYGLGTPPTRG